MTNNKECIFFIITDVVYVLGDHEAEMSLFKVKCLRNVRFLIGPLTNPDQLGVESQRSQPGYSDSASPGPPVIRTCTIFTIACMNKGVHCSQKKNIFPLNVGENIKHG